MVSRKLFVPALPPAQPGKSSTKGTSSRPNVGQTSSRSSSFINNNSPELKMSFKQQAGKVPSMVANVAAAYSNLPPDAKAKIQEAATSFVKSKTPSTPSGGGSDAHSSGYALSQAPNPAETRLDSGIQPNTYTSDYIDAKEGVCSPLHMTCAKVRIPSSASSRLFDYFNKVLAFDIQTAAQSNVSFNLNITTDFTVANLLTAFNALLDGLQIYYYFASIITYHNDPSNNNEGMLYLRSQITPQMMEDLTRLARRLSNTPCPPKMLELVRYLNTNYYSSVNQGSPMIKISPLPAYATMMNGSADITAALTELSSTANNQVYTLMRRAVPHWTIGTLYDVPIQSSYDSNFLTIFANLPASYYNAGVFNFQTVANSDTTIAYNSYTNTLDGLAFSLCTVYDTAAAGWNPALITLPSNSGPTNGNTRKSYYEVSGVKGFYPVTGSPFLLRARQETYTLNDASSAIVSGHLLGADRCLNVNANSLTETSMKSLDYLFSLNTIKKAAVANSGSENKRGPRRK